jgi:DNA invertase Pin-like site-specific DNA recombinase
MYIRLSRESVKYRDDESLSIENQRAILSKVISMMPGWVEKRVYIDDGASGAHFNRQGFQEMMEDARRGTINLILVKDLSRFGRNYLEAGRYLEEELPALGCRFVAIADGIDTDTGENDVMPFLNAINDFYLRNISDRIKSVITAKAKDGQKLSGAAPYGYDRDPEKNTRLVVDEYAAEVVKRIFNLRADGIGYTSIARILNRESILPPRLYYFRKRSRETKAVCSEIWSIRTVKLLLRNEIYLGHTVAFKRACRSYRDKRTVTRDEVDWIRVKNTHTPIIDETLWQNVQRMNDAVKDRPSVTHEPSLFSGIVVCADCHSHMAHTVSTVKRKDGREIKYGGYICRTHSRSGGAVCSWHRISEKTLKALVLDHIKSMAESITLDEGGMLHELRQRLVGVQHSKMIDLAKEKRELEQRLHALDLQLEKLYEDKVTGIITTDTFSAMMATTEKRRLETEDRLSMLTQTARHIEKVFGDIDRWIELIREKSSISEVDRELLECLIERIEIGERSDGNKTQNIRIFYKFVGSC